MVVLSPVMFAGFAGQVEDLQLLVVLTLTDPHVPRLTQLLKNTKKTHPLQGSTLTVNRSPQANDNSQKQLPARKNRPQLVIQGQ